MINEFLQDQAAAYVSGEMSAEEREPFALLLEFHEELREFVAGLAEVAAKVTLAGHKPVQGPSPALKARIMDQLSAHVQQTTPEAVVVSGPDGLVQWVNPAFSTMCGYAIEELRGKKLGPILQGNDTDRVTAERMRSAVHAHEPCRETILNYHKDGTPYWVEITIAPIRDGTGQPIYLVAREREIPHPAAA